MDATSTACTECLSSAAASTAGDSCFSVHALECVLGVECEAPASFHDSTCNPGNNVQACNYDGGDCCEKTCQSTKDLLTGLDNFCPFLLNEEDDLNCLNPEAITFQGFCGNLNVLPYIIERQIALDVASTYDQCGPLAGNGQCHFQTMVDLAPVTQECFSKSVQDFQLCSYAFCGCSELSDEECVACLSNEIEEDDLCWKDLLFTAFGLDCDAPLSAYNAVCNEGNAVLEPCFQA